MVRLFMSEEQIDLGSVLMLTHKPLRVVARVLCLQPRDRHALRMIASQGTNKPERAAAGALHVCSILSDPREIAWSLVK